MSASASDSCFKTGITDDSTNHEGKDTPQQDEEVVGAIHDHGEDKFNRLGWKRLTVVMLVEAIALGCLSLPSTFATLGMVPGVLICVGMGFVAIYTSYVIGQVKIKFPQVAHYPDVGRLIMGRWGYEILNVMLSVQLILLIGSHCLTGTIAFIHITGSHICSLVFGVVSAIILLALAIPPSFTEVAILGYIDFLSILLAVGITVIGTGVSTGSNETTNWSSWPREGTTFVDAFIAITNIAFAYSFALCQFSFMDEMHTPTDYVKSIWALGITEIMIYTLTGSLVYAFVGQDVQSPALLSAGGLLSKIAFGIALPVIYISGSINTVVLGRMIHGRVFKDSYIRFINTIMGWTTWLFLVTAATVIAFIIAEIIPFFSNLLSVSSALFISGFTFYLPAVMWFMLIRQGSWRSSWRNMMLSILNLSVFAIGLVILVGGTYSSIVDIVSPYTRGFLPVCDANRYSYSETSSEEEM